MLTHSGIWTAIDRLARENRLTASGLARRAGLDPTTFNRSKRITKDGKSRWPSTESIAKILAATETSFARFVTFVRPDQTIPSQKTVPLANLREIGMRHLFDATGFPTGPGWDGIAFPQVTDPHAFAVEVTSDQLEPIYQNGTILVMSPSTEPRRGDRILLRTTAGDTLVCRLRRRTAKYIELQSLSATGEDNSLLIDDVASLARIVWASQ